VPSNQEEWFKRLGGRSHRNEKDIGTRIETAKEELVSAKDFDYIVVNSQNKLDETVQKIEAIITAEHHKAAPRKINI
jgi:guanylate kinase